MEKEINLSEDDGRIAYERQTAKEGDIELEAIKSEEEDYESAPPQYEINTYPADFTLEVLHQKWRDGDITIPAFQRQFVWTQVQASKLIDSFLVGLPVPAIFLYTERKSQKFLVIDGQQRLKSIFYFFEGYFGQPHDDKRRVFRLTGLNDKSTYKEKTFSDLQEPDQRRLKNCVLRSFIVQQLNPEDDTSIYHIFERLNTGGTLLTNQEVRNSVYHGKLNNAIIEMNRYKHWRTILGKPDADSRQRDIELVLRYLALRNIAKYEKPMKDFLNKYMLRNRNPSDEFIKEARTNFERTCESTVNALNAKPFHGKAGLNAAVFDCVTVAFSHNLKRIPKDIEQRYRQLRQMKDFTDATTAHTTDDEFVKRRFELAENILFAK